MPGGAAFSFEARKRWLAEKAAVLRGEGLDAQLHVGAATPKPGMTLGIRGGKVVGEFAVWVTGETDYTVAAMTRSRTVEMVPREWGLRLTDATFGGAWTDFLSAFLRHERGDVDPAR